MAGADLSERSMIVTNLRCPKCGTSRTNYNACMPNGCPMPYEDPIVKGSKMNDEPGGITKSFSDVVMRNKIERQVGAITREPILQEREKTHGNFATNADISQELKRIMHGTYAAGGAKQRTNYGDMKPAQREALDQIALKLSRLLSGQPGFKDHWADIAGYAKLGEEACD